MTRFNLGCGPSADIAASIGGERLAGAVVEIAPGRHARPYRWEAAQEQWLLVLSGTPTVRTPEAKEVLHPGDVVCFPAGPDGAHEVCNAADEPCRVVMLSNYASLNVTVDPGSGTVDVRTPWTRSTFSAEGE